MIILDTHIVENTQKLRKLLFYFSFFLTYPLDRFQPRKHPESDLIPKPPVAGHAHARQLQDVPKFGGKRSARPWRRSSCCWHGCAHARSVGLGF